MVFTVLPNFVWPLLLSCLHEIRPADFRKGLSPLPNFAPRFDYSRFDRFAAVFAVTRQFYNAPHANAAHNGARFSQQPHLNSPILRRTQNDCAILRDKCATKAKLVFLTSWTSPRQTKNRR
jgi:hypothetical protein